MPEAGLSNKIDSKPSTFFTFAGGFENALIVVKSSIFSLYMYLMANYFGFISAYILNVSIYNFSIVLSVISIYAYYINLCYTKCRLFFAFI